MRLDIPADAAACISETLSPMKMLCDKSTLYSSAASKISPGSGFRHLHSLRYWPSPFDG